METVTHDPSRERPFQRHARKALEADERLAGMTAMEALAAGLVQRVHRHYGCPSYSPESGLPCELDPGHASAHSAHLDSNTAAWA